MTFEEVLKNLNDRKFLLDGLSQIEDGKLWSARVRKKGTTGVGYGKGKTIERAVMVALKSVKDSMSPTEWKKMAAPVNPSEPKKKKRVRLKGKR